MLSHSVERLICPLLKFTVQQRLLGLFKVFCTGIEEFNDLIALM